MKAGYTIFHINFEELYNYLSNTIIVTNFQCSNQVFNYYLTTNQVERIPSDIGRWNIKYKKL